MDLSRRGFIKLTGAGLAASSIGALGFGLAGTALAASVRPFKLSVAKETHNTCTYCSVACGILIYSQGDGAKNVRQHAIHVEGDPDHPVNRGTLCPKGAGLLDIVRAPGRVTAPRYRPPGGTEWQEVSWDFALDRIATLMKQDRDAHFVERNAAGATVNRWTSTGMLAASAGSNEVGLMTWKWARSMGMVTFDNQARVCHGPTVAGMAPTFGRGAMTNTWQDIKNADVVLVMGGNPAEAHPCGFKWVVEAKVENKAKLIVVDPRFTRTASVADYYAPIRPGSDIAFLNGLIRHLLENDAINHEYVRAYTNASLIVREDFTFDDGLFTGYNETKRVYDKSTWEYELDEHGFAKIDDTWQHPRCVINLLRQHVSRYTPELVTRITGTPQDKYLEICKLIAATAHPKKALTSLFALGWTQHTIGAQNVRAMGMIQLLLGNIGVAGGGMNALRGHSNIQGLSDLGLLSNMMPGYMTLPKDHETTFDGYMASRQFKPLRPGQTSYWQNYRKFFVSFQKFMYGKAATAENNWAYDWLPKLDVDTYDAMRMVEMMNNGQMHGFICQGFNPLQSLSDRGKTRSGLSKLTYFVSIDPLNTETANFWQDYGPQNPSDPSKIDTEVFQLPTTCFAEENGSLVNSARWLQWHWKAADAPGEARTDLWIMANIHQRLKALYAKDGGAFADSIQHLSWDYADPLEPRPDEIARESNGRALADIVDPATGQVVLKAGQQLDGFAQLRDDGTTMAGCWIFSGSWTEKGNQMARRDTTDPRDAGIAPNWAWSWPANRRILYNRASADPSGKPWNPDKPVIEWNGSKWVGFDVPDYGPTIKPEDSVGPFIMNQEGMGRLFARGMMNEGPFPEHYEPFESPGDNILHPNVKSNPITRVFPRDHKLMAEGQDFPHVGTTYSLTEHFHCWTTHSRINAILQPEEFVEIDEMLARDKGIKQGGWVRVWNKRGEVICKAYVTKRIKPLTVDGKTTHIIGCPTPWGFTGLTRKGYGANTLTPAVGDGNTNTPEFKAFLLNIERVAEPPAIDRANGPRMAHAAAKQGGRA